MTQRILSALTMLAPGLYAGRLLSELLHPGLAGAVALTLLTTVAGASLLWHRSIADRIWPLLALYIYILYPAFNPVVGLFAGAVALTAILLLHGAVPFERLTPRLLAVLIFFLTFGLYLHTLAPGLLAADNGELQLVAVELGVAHPPGFALYTMLAHLAMRLPLGATAAYRANLFSALAGATCLALVFLSAVRLTTSRIAGLLAVVALGSATTFWAQATTTNIRMLTAFFATLAIYLLILIYDSLHKPDSRTGATSITINRLLFLFALTLSLGITHHASLVFMGFVLTVALLWICPALLRQPARWVWPVAGLLLGFLPLLYFPIRAMTAAGSVRGASAELATLPGFLQRVLALGFRGDLFAYVAPQELWPRLLVMGNVMTFQFHWILLVGMLLGFVLLLRTRPKLALALGGAFALHTLVTATYRAPQTVEYMLPAYVPAALLLATAAAPRTQGTATPGSHREPLLATAWALLSAVLLAAAVVQAIQRYPSFRELSHDVTARRYTAQILQQAPAASVVLADWHWATPLWYLQEVEGLRPDLDIRYVFPTAEPYGQTWARRIAENLSQGRPVVATHFDAEAYRSLPPAEPLADAFLYPQAPRRELPQGYTALNVTLGDQIQLLGFRLDGEPLSPLRETTLTVAWQAFAGAQPPDLTLFGHLVRVDDGAIYAQQDKPAQPMPGGITLTQLRLTPRIAAQPGDYFVYVGAYESANGQPLPASDGAARTLLQTVLLRPMERPPYTAHRLYPPPFTGDQQLVGYDWDETLVPETRLYLHWRTPEGYVTDVIDNPAPGSSLPGAYGPWGVLSERPAYPPAVPEFYVPLGAGIVWTGIPRLAGQTPSPGETLTLAQFFASSRPLKKDLVVSVRLIGYEADGVHWAWWDLQDAVPALGAIPTLKWIDGSQVRDPHFLAVSPTAAPGQSLGALVTLYDAFTQRPLPILDERITTEFLGIPLGAAQVQTSSRENGGA